jgi:hypothetical protein
MTDQYRIRFTNERHGSKHHRFNIESISDGAGNGFILRKNGNTTKTNNKYCEEKFLHTYILSSKNKASTD